jgi:predicted Zn-dependent protease
MQSRTTTIVTWLISGLTVLAGCTDVGITGRQQLNFMPDSVMNSMSLEQFNQFISSSTVGGNAQQNAMVGRVGSRVAKGVSEYCKARGIQDPFAGYQWEFKVVEDKAVNAFAMPGGKVVVYTGLFPVAKDETGLAVVIGHEIAHVFAKHGAERMSQQLLVQMGGMALSEAVKKQPDATKALFMTSFTVGSQIGVLLPYSRLHESEADRLGMIFMAMGGYDPHDAVSFWQRMAEQSKGQGKPFALLSTHPSDATRIQDIQGRLAEALEYYKPQN